MKVPAQGITGAALLREAVTEYRAIIDLVRGALAKKLYPVQNDMWVDIQAVYPDRVIACKDGKNWQFTYSIDESNQVTLGDPIEVKEEFVPIKEALQLENATFIEAQGEPNSGKWLVRVIKAGLSLNHNYYPDAVLREAASMFNNARVFSKSDAEHIKGEGKAVEKLIGRLTEAKFVPGATPDTGEIQAVLEFIEPESPLAVKLREAYQRGMHDLFGFSVDVNATAKKAKRDGVPVREATKFTKVNSLDLIVEPGAGGQLIRMVESINPEKEQDTMRTRMLEAIQKKDPTKFAGMKVEDISDDDLDAAYREAIMPAPTVVTDNSAVAEQIRMVEARAYMRSTIAASNLPQPAKDRLLKEFGSRERFVEADVDSAITAEREYLARFTESGKPVIDFGDGGRVEDMSVKMADMLDAFFDPAHKNHRAVGSFKECYITITGDKLVTGRLADCDRSRLREAAGVSFREAVDSTTFSDMLGDSITRRMQAIYAGQTNLHSWRRVAKVGRTNDFRAQVVGRIGGYGNLPAVAEGGPYNALSSPGDDKATWAVSKRGGTESVTLETIKNDDVRLISAIPGELSLAAGNTLYEFAYDFFRTNPNAADGVALYHASHNNLFTGALSANEFSAHRLAMQKQTRAGSGKRMATSPGVILVPFDLQETAYNLFVRNQNLDKTFVQTINPEVITVDYWTDTSDWVTVAPMNVFPVLEIDFLDGQEEPELFVQDNPSVGSLFTNDKITYKIRHIYGGNLLVDAEKATTKAVVA